MIKTGDILKEKGLTSTVKVLGICGDVYFISKSYNHDVASDNNYTLSDLKQFFEIPEEKWIPNHMEVYYVPRPDFPNYSSFSFWVNDADDQKRLSRNLVFKTRDEAVKKAKQLLGLIR